MSPNIKKIILSALALAAAGIGPNLFVISQAGYAQLSDLAVEFLIPSIIFLILLYLTTSLKNYDDLKSKLQNGFIGGLIGTIGLEIVRETGFQLGGMPGELPKLMGVIMMNQFAQGPDITSNIVGWSYHFWNGAAFGIIYSIIIGKGNTFIGTAFGVLIGLGFMMSPVVISLGVGVFGSEFGIGFPITVILAHILFGTLLGYVIQKRNPEKSNLLILLKNTFIK